MEDYPGLYEKMKATETGGVLKGYSYVINLESFQINLFLHDIHFTNYKHLNVLLLSL